MLDDLRHLRTRKRMHNRNGDHEMSTRMMFARVVAGRFLDRINMIDRIKKGAEA